MNLIGNKFGKLTVTGKVYLKDHRSRVECLCECGKTTDVQIRSLKSGNTTSCGCMKCTLQIKHGLCKHPLYMVHKVLLQRCYNPNNEWYPSYGARGITVTDSWRGSDGFTSFITDMLPTFVKGLTLDRIDNDGSYTKANCRWATRSEQQRNKSNTVRIVEDGNSISLRDFCDKHNLPYQTSRLCVKKGMTADAILVKYTKEFQPICL